MCNRTTSWGHLLPIHRLEDLADLLTYRIKAAMADAWEMDWLGIAGVIQRLITDERVSGVPVWRPRGCLVGKFFAETLL
jgi:hypothetical protein